jgi:hypothetical protein
MRSGSQLDLIGKITWYTLKPNEFNGKALSNALASFSTFYKENNNKNLKKAGNRVLQSVTFKFISL